MTRARVSAKARWFGVVTVLAVASSVASSWRPAPTAPRTVVNVAKLLPPIFTASSAQGRGGGPTQVSGCSGKAIAGNEFSITILDFTAVTTGGVDRLITDTDAALNFAGNDGDVAGKFFTALAFTAGDYNKLKITVSPTLTIKGKVTCDVDGGGPIATRTYYTDGTADFDNGDPSELIEANAIPVATQIKFGGGSGTSTSVELSVNFTVNPGVTTTMNMGFKNEGAFVLWDISSITPAVGDTAYKVFPGQPDSSGARVP